VIDNHSDDASRVQHRRQISKPASVFWQPPCQSACTLLLQRQYPAGR
jgi:hypothetical protein